ncbi:MAG: YabP/YqfC family sporulation protein, partial [Bacillota bacterium]
LLELVGVLEVVDFDENKVSLETNSGNLIIIGSDLRMKHLDLDNQQLIVKGHIIELKYDKELQAKNFLKKLFK